MCWVGEYACPSTEYSLMPRLLCSQGPEHSKCQRNIYLLEEAGSQDILFCSEAKSS